MIAELLTVKLKSNGREVLAKMYKGSPSAVTYANRTQASRKADSLGAGWEVCQFSGSRVFYVAKPRAVAELFAETHQVFQDAIKGIAAKYGKTWEEVYGWWREYSKACWEQSALLSEFEGWYQPQLCGKPACQVAPEPKPIVAKYYDADGRPMDHIDHSAVWETCEHDMGHGSCAECSESGNVEWCCDRDTYHESLFATAGSALAEYAYRRQRTDEE